MPSPYEIAKTWTGTREGDAKLDDFLNNGGKNLSSADYAWCSRFIKASAAQAGVDVSKASDMARSWLNVGEATKTPKEGDIAVFSRGSDPSLGHVGFFQGYNPDGSIKLLSGNHNDQVAESSYPASRLLGFRTFGANPNRGGSMNGGMGMSPTGTAGVAGPIQTQDAGHSVAEQPLFKDFGLVPSSAPTTPSGGGGSAPMALPFGYKLAAGDGSEIPAVPKAQPVNLDTTSGVDWGQVDFSKLFALAQQRKKLGV